jgi:hypothetical protein
MDTRPRIGATQRADSGADPMSAGPAGQRAGRTGVGEAATLSAVARVIRLDQGLYALGIGPIGAASGTRITIPCIQLTSPPSAELDPVDILTAWDDQGAWLGPEGGTVVVRAPPGGGQVLATLYDQAAVDAAVLADFEISRLDQPRPGPARPEPPRVEPQAVVSDRAAVRDPAAAAEVDIEVALHVQRVGDRTFAGGVWCGTIGQKLQIEALGIRPLERIAETDIEYKAFGPAGRETRWVSEGKLCGTRGRGIPLTGFAVRLAPHLADRFDVVYQGAFFMSGVMVPVRNGEPCLPPLADDTLEAVNIRVVERAPG